MKRVLMLAALLLAFRISPATADTAKPKSHGNTVSGTVARVDPAARTFVVRTAAGTETTLVRTEATRIRGEALKAGDRVAVRWLERDGKKIATAIRVEPSAPAPPPAIAPESR